MAVFTVGAAIADAATWSDFFEPDDPARISGQGATTFRWTNPDGSVVTLTGTGFTFDGTTPLTGRVTGFTVTNGAGQAMITGTGFNADLASLYRYAFGSNPDGAGHDPASGFTFLSVLMLGNDTYNGSTQDDYFSGGNDRGSDTINAGDGNDFISAYSGADQVNGGNGTDTLSYQSTYYDLTSKKGVVIKVAAGTVNDSWGNTDRFTGFERFRGSKFADTFNGGAGDDAFMGLGGNDKVNGGAGFDELSFYRDGSFGGTKGITADWVAGTVIDGFGNTDTFSGIEFMIGTIRADKFTGNGQDNTFAGGSGVDRYEGGAGSDWIDLDVSAIAATQGAVVNLAAGSNQISNDGFGNAETAIGVENLFGTRFGDSFTGNGAKNQLRGELGNDTISGGAGADTIWGDGGADVLTGGLANAIDADTFVYSRRGGVDPWGDTITDFDIFNDRISIYVPDFAGMTMVKNVENAPQANGEGSWFFYNVATNGLYWDRDGSLGQYAPILLVTLTGVDGIRPSDIVLFNTMD